MRMCADIDTRLAYVVNNRVDHRATRNIPTARELMTNLDMKLTIQTGRTRMKVKLLRYVKASTRRITVFN